MQKANSTSENLPSISIIIPTYNAQGILAQCLESIKKQDYPREKIEIIIADGGSKDRTIDIARKYNVDKVIHNKLQVEEFGKALCIEASKNEIIAFIDQDNILVSSNWLKKMVEPFKEMEIVGSEPLFYSYRKGDPAIVSYCSLIGADDPLYVYLGYYDRFCYFKDKWTEAPTEQENKGNYLHVKLLSSREIPTIGANGFMVRSNIIKKLKYRPFIHTDFVYQMVLSGFRDFAKVKVGLIHLHAVTLRDFLKKKLRRVQRYGRTKRSYNDLNLKNVKLLTFILYSLLFLTALDSIRGYVKKPNLAWLLHPLICYMVTLAYATMTFTAKLQLIPVFRKA